ncbi:MAG: hypothetical protein JWL91_329 [Sphingomonas bacterium]|nr:hypothetical protein [Sphingomonas bacterium]MDB5688453.1 hypothetical protein [Sphingomonas bacterium]
MTATTPDNHPDSLPAGPSEDIEQVSPASDPGRESVEGSPDSGESGASYGTHDGSPLDPPGIEDGVSGSAGYNKSQDDVTS